jgi:hypothetical protein
MVVAVQSINSAIQQSDNSQQSWTTWLYILLGLAAIILILWAIDRIFKPKQFKSAAGNALMTAEVFFRPSRQNVIEAKQEKKAEEDDSGEPPVR